MIKLLKVLAAMLGVLLITLVAVLLFVDFGRFEPRIEQAVSEATGRDFQIDGDLEIRALPAIQVSANDVSLSNAEWGSEPEMARIGHFSARVNVLSLLTGPPVIEEVRLKDVDVLLETDAEGTGNWAMGEPAPEEPPAEDDTEGGALEMPVTLRFAELDNIRLRYLPTLESGLTVASLGVTADEQGQHTLEGKGQWKELPFELAGTAADRQVELDVTLGELALASTLDMPDDTPVSYTHLTLPTTRQRCRSRWAPEQ